MLCLGKRVNDATPLKKPITISFDKAAAAKLVPEDVMPSPSYVWGPEKLACATAMLDIATRHLLNISVVELECGLVG